MTTDTTKAALADHPDRRISSDGDQPDFWPIAKLTVKGGVIADAGHSIQGDQPIRLAELLRVELDAR